MTSAESTSSRRAEDPFARAVPSALEQLGSIPGSGSWPLSERLSAFFFMLLDAVEETARNEQPEDPSAAFRREASGFFSPFQDQLRGALPRIGQSGDVPGINRMVADLAPNRVVVAETMVQLIQVTMADDSPERQRSAALADRVLSLLASTWTTPIPAKVVDVIRYTVEAGYLPLDRLPLIGEWFGSGDGKHADDGKPSPESDGGDHDGQ